MEDEICSIHTSRFRFNFMQKVDENIHEVRFIFIATHSSVYESGKDTHSVLMTYCLIILNCLGKYQMKLSIHRKYYSLADFPMLHKDYIPDLTLMFWKVIDIFFRLRWRVYYGLIRDDIDDLLSARINLLYLCDMNPIEYGQNIRFSMEHRHVGRFQ